MKKCFLYLLSCFVLMPLAAVEPFFTHPLSERLKTLQVTRADSDVSYPVIYLDRSADAIDIRFDFMAAEMHQISYSLIHCDVNWRPSDLSVNEYIDGFQFSYIEDYDYSRSTNIDYVNYHLQIPNQDVSLKLSGNYAVVLYDEDDEDTLGFACFSVVEPEVSISGMVSGMSTRGPSGHNQQLNFSIDYSHQTIRQPTLETQVLVVQNNDWNTRVLENRPTYVHTDRLVYDQHPSFAFSGRGEYRHFEASSVRYASKGVANISFFSPFYHFTLAPADLRQLTNYEYDNDINGRFVVRRQESDDEDAPTEAEYIVVHFSVPMAEPILDAKVYIGGDFVYNAIDASNQMTYSFERKAYECSLLLKQGYYNYRYFVVSNRDGNIASAPIEMDAYQTENDYQIYFYYRAQGERYDRLIGYQVVNSLNY